MRFQLMTLKLVTMIGVALGVTAARAAPFLIVGDDAKAGFADGKAVVSPPGNDAVLIVDVVKPLDPKIVANLPLKNSVVGPPVNLAIDPTDSVAIVAELDECRAGRRRLEASAGQQDLRDRSQGKARQARQHHRG